MGPNSYLNSSNRCNRDEDFTQNPQALSSMTVSVRLAITPIVHGDRFYEGCKEQRRQTSGATTAGPGESASGQMRDDYQSGDVETKIVGEWVESGELERFRGV